MLLSVVLLYWGLQGSVTWCREILNLKPSPVHDGTMWPLCLHSTSHLLRIKVYAQDPSVRHHCEVPAEDVRWGEGCRAAAALK